MKKNKRVGSLTLPDFKTYYKVSKQNSVVPAHTDRHLDQQNRKELSMRPYVKSSTSVTPPLNAGKMVSSANDTGEKNGYPHAKESSWTLTLHHM